MLTEDQKRYMEKVSETEITQIKPHNSEAAEFARKLVDELQDSSGLEVLWSGGLALGISGSNDIDITIFGDPKDFEATLPKLTSILGKPQIEASEKVLWRTTKDGHKVDAYLGSEDSDEVQAQVKFFRALQNDKALLNEYRILKEGAAGLSLREHYRKKAEFYNKVLGVN